MADFGDLYEFVSASGIVVPLRDQDEMVTKVKDAFKSVFGADVDTSSETAIGRLIEAQAILFIDVLGVNAQNANSFNPNQALGSYLDALGAIWGIDRDTDETDDSYRQRLLTSQSRGSGYRQSVCNAVGNVTGVTSVCVLDNGHGDAAVVDGITLPAHSMFVCVGGTSYDADAVAKAIYLTKSAGCDYQTDASNGEVVTCEVEDSGTSSHNTGSVAKVYFHKAVQKPMSVYVTVNGDDYTGSDIKADVRTAIKDLVAEHSINDEISSAMVASAIAAEGTGIVCKTATIKSGTTEEDPIAVLPYQYFSITDADISVTVV